MSIKKPKIPDGKIQEILVLLSENTKWDDIEFQASCSRNTISRVKFWFESLPWEEAKVFCHDDEAILRLRDDYLKGKAVEKQPPHLLPFDMLKHQRAYFQYLASLANNCFTPPIAFFYNADWERGDLKFFTGDCALCGGECVFEKITKAIEKGDKEKLKSITRPRAYMAKTVVLRWKYEPRAELLIEPSGYEDFKEHIRGTELCDILLEIKKLGIYYILSAPIVLAYLEDEAWREHPELQLKPKKFEAARTDDETAKFLNERIYELWLRLIELNNKAVRLIRQWLLDPLTMPKTECPHCTRFGGLGYC